MNSAKDIARTKKWVLDNPERSRKIKKKYKERNRAKVLRAARDYTRKKRLLMTDEDRERIRKYNRQRHHKTYYFDLNLRIKINLRARLYKALKGIAKSRRTAELLGCSIESFRIYLESKFEPGMSWQNYGLYWHIDHIMPCAIFDLSKPEHQKRCFHFSNMQPLGAIENLRKNATAPNQFNLL